MADTIFEVTLVLNCVTMLVSAFKRRYELTLISMALADACIIALLLH